MASPFLSFVLLGTAVLLFGCIQPSGIFPNSSITSSALRGPTNVIEVIALCTGPPENAYKCNIDTDCICNEGGKFIGNKVYYEYCTDKSIIALDMCIRSRQHPIACINNACTNAYPRTNWTFENCDELISEATQTACKKELALEKARKIETTPAFCDLLKEEPTFNKTQCRDIFYRTQAWNTKNYLTCDNISNDAELRDCKNLVVTELIKTNGSTVDICAALVDGRNFTKADCEDLYQIYDITKSTINSE